MTDTDGERVSVGAGVGVGVGVGVCAGLSDTGAVCGTARVREERTSLKSGPDLARVLTGREGAREGAAGAGGAEEAGRGGGPAGRGYALLSAYAHPTRSPVLTWHMMLSAYAHPTRSPVLTWHMVLYWPTRMLCVDRHSRSIWSYEPTRMTHVAQYWRII
eukprot:118938-Rhodomonas_salina.2